VTGVDFCYLTTIGRRSGRPHEIEIWYARQGDTLYMLAGAGRSADWVRNIEAHALATVRIGDVSFEAVGRVLDGFADADEAALASQLVFDKYQPGYDGSLLEWRERSLPVAFDLAPEQAGQE
jgi:deazaflavin-dependent oxidoreductase (nitroreductase family)